MKYITRLRRCNGNPVCKVRRHGEERRTECRRGKLQRIPHCKQSAIDSPPGRRTRGRHRLVRKAHALQAQKRLAVRNRQWAGPRNEGCCRATRFRHSLLRTAATGATAAAEGAAPAPAAAGAGAPAPAAATPDPEAGLPSSAILRELDARQSRCQVSRTTSGRAAQPKQRLDFLDARVKLVLFSGATESRLDNRRDPEFTHPTSGSRAPDLGAFGDSSTRIHRMHSELIELLSR